MTTNLPITTVRACVVCVEGMNSPIMQGTFSTKVQNNTVARHIEVHQRFLWATGD